MEDSSGVPATESDNVLNNSSVLGITVTEALETLKSSLENFPKIQFTTNGITDTFDIGVAIGIRAVFWNGALLDDSDWSQSGTSFTLTFTPEAGQIIKPI